MSKTSFDVSTVFENDTYYLFDRKECDIRLNDTKRETNPKYTTVTMKKDRTDFLDAAFVLKGLRNVVLDFDGTKITFH